MTALTDDVVIGEQPRIVVEQPGDRVSRTCQHPVDVGLMLLERTQVVLVAGT